MKDLTKYYIDLSKCSESEIKELAFLMKRTKILHEEAFDYMSKGETFNHFVCLAQTDSKEWTLWDQNAIFNKTELTYSEFIKLFEGGEGDKRELLIKFAHYIQGWKNQGLDFDCVEREVDKFLNSK